MVKVRIPWQEEKEHIEIELYLVDNRGNVSPLCSTFSVEGEMRDLIWKMYEMVSADRRTINVSSAVKGVIDDFMEIRLVGGSGMSDKEEKVIAQINDISARGNSAEVKNANSARTVRLF